MTDNGTVINPFIVINDLMIVSVLLKLRVSVKDRRVQQPSMTYRKQISYIIRSALCLFHTDHKGFVRMRKSYSCQIDRFFFRLTESTKYVVHYKD